MLKEDRIINGIILEHQEEDASQLDRLKSYEEKLTNLRSKDNGIYSEESD